MSGRHPDGAVEENCAQWSGARGAGRTRADRYATGRRQQWKHAITRRSELPEKSRATIVWYREDDADDGPDPC